MDLRIEKTHQSIVNAFIALRSGKPLEKITVKELCEKAQINKSTFYFHYADIYELSDSLETEIVTSIINSLAHPEYMVENPGAFTQELFLAYLSRDSLIQTLFSGSRSGCLIQKIESSLKKLIYERHPDYRDDPVKNLILSYQIYGAYYAFSENRGENVTEVIAVLGRISEELQKLLHAG
ncbi:TetR/AcrR family transcriptional regulator [Hungatella effluvii]|uniref:TetR/AcrR family transcriptional regulator n=1 Tax=Hungatella effluvii TaxID=1096246 RepID=UPI0022E79DB8|nr:TetR/AcrR family transcriptional regulator [Hungatella effluvii]